MFLRTIIWILLFILAYRAMKFILRIMSGGNKQNSDLRNKNRTNSNLTINKEDIIEADFEEIKDSDQNNSK